MNIVGAGIDLRGNRHRVLYGLPVIEVGGRLVRPGRMDWTASTLVHAQPIGDVGDIPMVFESPLDIGQEDELGVVVVGTSFATAVVRAHACRALLNEYDAGVLKVVDSGSDEPQLAAVLNHALISAFRSGLRALLMESFDAAYRLGRPLEAHAAFDNLAASGTISHDRYLVLSAVLARRIGDSESFVDLHERIVNRGLQLAYFRELLSRERGRTLATQLQEQAARFRAVTTENEGSFRESLPRLVEIASSHDDRESNLRELGELASGAARMRHSTFGAHEQDPESDSVVNPTRQSQERDEHESSEFLLDHEAELDACLY